MSDDLYGIFCTNNIFSRFKHVIVIRTKTIFLPLKRKHTSAIFITLHHNQSCLLVLSGNTG